MQRAFYLIVACIAITACARRPALLSAAAPSTADAATRLLGTWRWSEVWDRPSPQSPKDYFLSEHPLGYAMYDATGHFMIAVLRGPPLPNMPIDMLRSSSRDTLLATFNAGGVFFGTYSVDTARAVIIHHAEGDSWRRFAGQDYIRSYRFSGDTLFLADGPLSRRSFVRVRASAPSARP